MNYRVLQVFGVAALSFIAGVFATAQNKDAWPWSEAQDGYRADSKHHRVLYEDDNVRILEVVLAPGEKESPHVHRLSAIFVIDQFPTFSLTSCTDATHCNDSDAFTIPAPNGAPSPVLWRNGPDVKLHYATNKGTTPFHAYKIEYKKISFPFGQPITGLPHHTEDAGLQGIPVSGAPTTQSGSGRIQAISPDVFAYRGRR